jgi:hypothetical protein
VLSGHPVQPEVLVLEERVEGALVEQPDHKLFVPQPQCEMSPVGIFQQMVRELPITLVGLVLAEEPVAVTEQLQVVGAEAEAEVEPRFICQPSISLPVDRLWQEQSSPMVEKVATVERQLELVPRVAEAAEVAVGDLVAGLLFDIRPKPVRLLQI